MISNCVVQAWVSELTWKQQTVLLCALRGHDGIVKEDISKELGRAVRSIVLQQADKDNPIFRTPKFDIEKIVKEFLVNIDHYTAHWLMHITHAIEIIGYKHPDATVRIIFFKAYREIVWALHLNPETEIQLDNRLKDNR